MHFLCRLRGQEVPKPIVFGIGVPGAGKVKNHCCRWKTYSRTNHYFKGDISLINCATNAKYQLAAEWLVAATFSEGIVQPVRE